MAWHPHAETSKNPPEDRSFYDALWPLDLVVPGLRGPSSSPRAGAGPPAAEPTSAGSRVPQSSQLREGQEGAGGATAGREKPENNLQLPPDGNWYDLANKHR